MNQETEDLTTDDEIIREGAFTQGVKTVSKFNLEPISGTSFSWINRIGLFGDNFGDPILIAAAYAFLHSEAKPKIRAIVNDKQKFIEAVDEWMDSNVTHHSELEPVTNEMNEAIEVYMSAITKANNQSDQGRSGPKN